MPRYRPEWLDNSINLRRECDHRETRDYYGAPHGACRKGVYRRRDAASEQSAAQFPCWTDKDAMFFVGLRTANTRFRIIVTLQRPKRRSRVLASGRAAAAANTRGGKEDQRQRAVHNVHIGRPSPTVWNFSTMQW